MAGVTVGLGVSIGGLAAPLPGLGADAYGPRGVLSVLLVVPPVTAVAGLLPPRPEVS